MSDESDQVRLNMTHRQRWLLYEVIDAGAEGLPVGRRKKSARALESAGCVELIDTGRGGAVAYATHLGRQADNRCDPCDKGGR